MSLEGNPDESVEERSGKADREIRRSRLVDRIRILGGTVSDGDEGGASEQELDFFERAVDRETEAHSTPRERFSSRGLTFMPPAVLTGPCLKKELWRLR